MIWVRGEREIKREKREKESRERKKDERERKSKEKRERREIDREIQRQREGTIAKNFALFYLCSFNYFFGKREFLREGRFLTIIANKKSAEVNTT